MAKCVCILTPRDHHWQWLVLKLAAACKRVLDQLDRLDNILEIVVYQFCATLSLCVTTGMLCFWW